jgi:hypothetical protein
VATILGVIGLVLSAAGVMLFPWPSSAVDPLSFSVQVLSPRAPVFVSLVVTEPDRDHVHFALTIGSQRSDADVAAEQDGTAYGDDIAAGVTASFVLPPTLTPVDTSDAAERDDDAPWLLQRTLAMDGAAGTYFSSVWEFDATGSVYGVAKSGSELVAALPQVTLDTFEAGADAPYVEVTYPVVHADQLRWNANEPHSTSDSTATWVLPATQSEFVSFTTPDPYRSRATDVAEVGTSQFTAFAAGALVAIGTGAALMVIPEVIHERARGRGRKRATR